jgi:polar amino acid transport system substrate-binding protein
LYICFFGIGAYVYKTYGLSVSSISAAVLVFSLYAGSGIAGVLLPTFVSERRSGYDQSKGMFSSIAKAYRSNLDAVVANSVNIVKATGMASAIALPELITTSNSVIADWGNSSTMMNVLLLSYFLYVLIVMFILKSIVRLVT